MAQRATGFAKRPATGRAAERARSQSGPLGEPVRLPIAELLEPYGRQGLSIRVERLAHGAKLSKGRNNGDRSYSLTPEDVDNLEYLPPSASYEAHTLAVRIVDIAGGDGETLAVLDLPIAAHAGAANDIAPSAPTPIAVVSNAETVSVAEELTRVKASLAAHEIEFAATRKLEESERSRRALEEEFAAAQTAWEDELHKRLSDAAAEANSAIEKARVAWQGEQSARALKLESGAQAAASRAVEEARKRWDTEAQAAIAKAQADWKAAEAVRLAAAEARWRDQSDAATAEWRAKAERAEAALAEARKAASAHANTVAASGNAELRQLREQLAAMQANLSATQANLAARKAELAEARSAADVAQSHVQQNSTDRAKAEQEWKSAEAARFAAAEARWRDQSDAATAEWRAKAERAEAALAEARTEAAARASVASTHDAESRQLREQLAALQANLSAAQNNLAARNAELAEARATADLARSHAQQTSTGFKQVEQKWKKAEAERLAAAEARWKTEADKASADSAARVERIEAALAEARAQAEARQQQLGAAEASLAARNQELAQLRATAEEVRTRFGTDAEMTRARWEQEMESALAQAQESWKAGEAGRLAAAEAQWKSQSVDTTAQLHLAEIALAQAHAEAQAQAARADEELHHLRDELTAARAAVIARGSEPGEATAAIEQARANTDESLINVAAEIEKAQQKWRSESELEFAKAEQAWRAEEAPRLASSEARWQETVAGRFTQAEERIERAESALADSRACSDALRHELSAAQAGLANREIELAEARATLEQERERWNRESAAQPVRKPTWEDDEEERRAKFRRRLIRDVAVVACLAGLAFMMYPRMQPVVAEGWPQNFSLKSDFQPLLQMAGLAAPPPPPAAEPEPRQRVDVRMANLRENPSTGAAVVIRLARNVEVTPVDRRGDWVFVRVGEGANQRQGWIANSVLKDAGDKAAARQ
ncbi:MAG TPA: SH3 domain-containing protein [Rhizomicrobium sp.]